MAFATLLAWSSYMINADKPGRWKSDVADSVRTYNSWFLSAAPQAYRAARAQTARQVRAAFHATHNLASVTPDRLVARPAILPALRMSTAPPIARDRLAGLADVPKSLVMSMENGKIPPRMARPTLEGHLQRICNIITDLLDLDLFPWLASGSSANKRALDIAETVVTDRLCGAVADPIIRNAQEQRQLEVIAEWLNDRGYRQQPHPTSVPLQSMEPGTYSFRVNVVVKGGGDSTVNMPLDVVIQPHHPEQNGFPLLIEAKSAGDFTNTNKRRKEEVTKMHQLRATYGKHVRLILLLSGYFDSGYLGYVAAEGIDWVWEHRIQDLADAGV